MTEAASEHIAVSPEAIEQSDGDRMRQRLIEEINFDIKNLSIGTLMQIRQSTLAEYWRHTHYQETEARRRRG
ncbi:MAG: hypothetical protein WDN27_06615 [Candidatus Saccharibacteria bacterium]